MTSKKTKLKRYGSEPMLRGRSMNQSMGTQKRDDSPELPELHRLIKMGSVQSVQVIFLFFLQKK